MHKNKMKMKVKSDFFGILKIELWIPMKRTHSNIKCMNNFEQT